MSRYLLDSNAAGDTINGRRGLRDRVKTARAAGHDIGIGIPVLGELYGGIENSSSRDQNLDILRRNIKVFRLWPFTPKAAEIYGRIYAELRRKGRMIQQIDIQIAAIALSLGQCSVVTDDGDFNAVTGLKVENWAVRKPV